MNSLLSARLPTAVKLGVPLAAALLAAACASSSGGGSGAGSSGAAGGPMQLTTKSGSAGTYLTDGSGRTVYLWVKDGMDKSECSGACISHWQPVPGGNATVSGSAQSSDLGTITRSDGSKQLTYDGHPLYYYFGDSGAGQTNGQGSNDFGAQWWLVAPSGTAITGSSTSNAPSPSASSSAAGGWS